MSSENFSYDPDLRPPESGQPTSPPSSSRTRPANKYGQKGPNLGAEYTQKDLDILLKCNSEGTYYRGIPAMLLGMGALAAVAAARQITYSKFLYAGVGVGSFISGKVSYLNVCRQRLIESDSDSELAQMLRKGKRPGQGPCPKGRSKSNNEEFARDDEPVSSVLESGFDTDRELKLEPDTWKS